MKVAIAIVTLNFLAMSCKDIANSVTANETQIIEQGHQDRSLTKEAVKAKPTIDIIHETENLKLYGDTRIDKDKISYASIRFEPYIGFHDFKVTKVDHKKYAGLDLKSNEIARSYRTRLREGFNGVHFQKTWPNWYAHSFNSPLTRLGKWSQSPFGRGYFCKLRVV